MLASPLPEASLLAMAPALKVLSAISWYGGGGILLLLLLMLKLWSKRPDWLVLVLVLVLLFNKLLLLPMERDLERQMVSYSTGLK